MSDVPVEVCMRPFSILVSGDESRFLEELQPLDEYLQSIGCETVHLSTSEAGMVSKLSKLLRGLKHDQPLMLAYSGHGSIFGWENSVSYVSLARIFGAHRGDVIVLNDTCHGFKFRHYLKFIRSKKNTSLIVRWDGDGVMYGGTFNDPLTYWPQSTIVENEIVTHIFSSAETGDIEIPIQLRWGAILDHHFFPDPSP